MNRSINLTEQLVQQCKHGNERARLALFQQFVRPMYNVAFRILGNQYDAEDVVQDSFVKVFRKINSLNDTKAFASWLKQIVVNEAISHIRKQKKMKFAPETVDVIPDVEEPDSDIELPMEQIMKAVMELPQGARVVFTLRAIEGYRFNEIARISGQTENNCKVQYHRAKKLLNSKLKSMLYA